jgi:DNA primase catalytic core, N-terminal domain
MNWEEFLEAYDIHYVNSGPNTRRGEISISCPWCGDDDPSQHLGIALTSENWGCLRHGGHRGKAAHRLVQALLGCSYTQAKLIVRQYSRSDPSNLEEALAALTGVVGENRAIANVNLPKECRPILYESRTTYKFIDYLLDRGFNEPERVALDYSLLACLTGQFKDRIIFPFYDANQDLVGYTGRALGNPINAPRYLSSEFIKNTIFNEYNLSRCIGDTLFVVEGPFDALKLDFYGYPVRATCTFGTTLHINQLAILAKLKKKFRRTIVLFDVGAAEQAWHLADSLGLEVGSLPEGVDDPGDLSAFGVTKFVRQLLTG